MTLYDDRIALSPRPGFMFVKGWPWHIRCDERLRLRGHIFVCPKCGKDFSPDQVYEKREDHD